MDYKQFYENVKTHFEMLCTDEIRAHASADVSHDLDFQIFRILSGYEKALETHFLTVAVLRKYCGHEMYDNCMHDNASGKCTDVTCPIILGLIKEGICQTKS